MGRPEAQTCDAQPHPLEHQPNQAPFKFAVHAQQPQQQLPAEQLPPPNNPSTVIEPNPDHEADDDHHEHQAIANHHDQTHEHQAMQPHYNPLQLAPQNPSHSVGTSRPDHHQQPRPLHDAAQLPPTNPYNTNLMLHHYHWPHHNYNAPAPPAAYQVHPQRQALMPTGPVAPRPHPTPTPYYPPLPVPHHHHHHQASSAPAIYYTTSQVLFPPPAAYQFVPHHSGQLQYYNNPVAAARNQLPPLHYNPNYIAETGIPVQNVQYLPMLLPQPAGIDGAWKTGLFQCLDDPPNAIMTLFCPCWTFGQVAEIVNNGQTSCAVNSLIYMLITVCIFVPCLLSCTYRKKLRNKFDLPESPAPDCIIHFLCEWCALCQEHRELELRGLDPSLGWVGNMEHMQRLQQKRQAAMAPPTTQRMTGY
ncbi:PREDICTED: early nodulin-75-like isoform X1 [Prunus mume]|nr:PREDICTED: early nodulin-75-like isoform X1 [Prunus mume]